MDQLLSFFFVNTHGINQDGPNKLYEIIIARVEAGESKSSIAKVLNINRSTIYKAIKAYREYCTTDYVKPSRPSRMTRMPS